MKIRCKTEQLLEGIVTVQKAIAVRTTLPILEGILLVADHNLILTGYDMELGIRYTMPATIQEPGRVVINSKFLGDLVRRISEPELTIEIDDMLNVRIDSGSCHFKIKGMSAETYPEIKETAKQKEMLLPQKELKTLIRRTLFSVSTDGSRPNLTGCFFNSKPERLEMVGIDGYRVSIARLEPEEEKTFEDMSFIIPAKTLKEVQSLLDDSGDVNLIYCENQLVFDFGNNVVISRLIPEAYMRYENIIPQTSMSVMKVNTQALLETLERAVVMLGLEEKRIPLNLKYTGGPLECYLVSSRGDLRETLECEIEGDTFDIDFNPRYLHEALRVVDDEEVRIAFNGESGPCRITPVEGLAYQFLVLPVRR